MSHASPRRPTASKSSRARLILPIAGVGLLLACAVVLTLKLRPTQGEAEVLRSIHTIALHKSQKRGVPDGGPLGPWWLSATKLEPLSGTLRDFTITTDTMIIAAETARIEIDAFDDTFSIDMHGVVLTRLGKGPQDAEEFSLVEYEHYRLGPAPIGIDIIPDAGRLPPPVEPVPTSNTSPLAGVQAPE